MFVLSFRRPPRPTRTYTPVPYPTRFRAAIRVSVARLDRRLHDPEPYRRPPTLPPRVEWCLTPLDAVRGGRRPPGRARSGGRRRLQGRSEEHTSELQSLMRISYAVLCLKKKTDSQTTNYARCHTVNS